MTLGDWGQACLTFFVVLVCWGLLFRRTWGLLAGCGVLAGADFFRGLVYHGGGWVPPGWWGAWSGSWPAAVAWGLGLLYCSWGLYPFLLVASGVRARTFLLAGVVIVLSAVIASVWPVVPPWMVGSARATSVVPGLAAIVAGDVSPVAAFPSVHVAIPVVVAWSERSWAWSAYAVMTGVVVVLAGEHWVTDVLGGVCVAVVVVTAAGICGALGRWCSALGVCRTSSSWCVGGGASDQKMLCVGGSEKHKGW